MINIAHALARRLPDRIKVSLRRTFSPRFCPVCRQGVRAFDPLPAHLRFSACSGGFPYPPESFETLNVEEYHCPNCGSADRDRLCALYLRERLAANSSNQRIRLVEFAPSDSLSRFIRRELPVVYRTADLFMPGVDDKIDITRMDSYEDGVFDIFICSHVLEHVSDDLQAMRELYRIIRPGGWGIALVPIGLAVTDTTEDPSQSSPAMRLRLFGQDDHVRLYARNDYISRLQTAGFNIKEFGSAHFGERLFRRCGITPKRILYVVEKACPSGQGFRG